MATKSSSRKSSSSRKASSSKSSSKKASSSKRSSREVTDGGAIADNRAAVGHKNQGVQGGLVDNMTRRNGNDAVQGHFVTIDRTHSGISKDVGEQLDGRDGYGVYLEPAEVDDKGFPKTVVVQLRDSSNARVTVPYDSLRPVDLTERRS